MTEQFRHLRTQMSQLFNKSELATLCFDLGINYENISGDTLDDKVQNLILFCQRRTRLGDLVHACQRSRPHVSWADLLHNMSSNALPVALELKSDPSNLVREIIAPQKVAQTDAILHLVFGNIASLYNATAAIPINQDFDFRQRGPNSVLASFEKIRIGDDVFFQALEYLWPVDKRPLNAGIGHTYFLPFTKTLSALDGVIFVVTTRGINQRPANYGRYANTPIEGIDFIIDKVIESAQDNNVESLAVPLLGAGHANITRTYQDSEVRSLLRYTVLSLTIHKLELELAKPAGSLRSGVVVVYSPQPFSKFEHEMWDFVIKFSRKNHVEREKFITELVEEFTIRVMR